MQNSSNDLFSRIFESSREFKKVTTITTCAMFGALAIVLGYYSFKITPNLKIGFSAIPNMLVDYLFGPVVGCLFGGAMDVIKFMLKPDGGFMPGFTFDAMLAAYSIHTDFFPDRTHNRSTRVSHPRLSCLDKATCTTRPCPGNCPATAC